MIYLWKYDVNNKTWTWITGSDTPRQEGFYGEKGNGNSSTTPGARSGAVGWYDSLNEEFWLYGGYYYYNSSDQGTIFLKFPQAYHIFVFYYCNKPIEFNQH